MLRRIYFCVPLFVSLVACGGGSTPGIPSGPGSKPTPSSTPAVYATLAPPSSRQGDIKTLAVGAGNSTSIAYWPDNNVVAVSAYTTVYNAADGTILAQPLDGNRVIAMTYSPATHSLVFATGRNIFALGLNGSETTLASNFTNIIALAAGSDGTIYAFDANHIVKIHDGAVSNVTAPGSFISSSNTAPSLAVSPDGTLWLSDADNDRIDRVTASGSITPFAGSCKPGPGGILGKTDSCWAMPIAGTGSAANFSTPGALAYDAATSTLYVADQYGNQLWAISSNGSAAPVAGYGAAQNLDSNGLAAFLNFPIALALQPAAHSVDILEYGPPPEEQIVAYSTIGTAAPPYTSPSMLVNAQNGLMQTNLAVALDGGAWSADESGANIVRISPTGGVTTYSAGGVSATDHVAVDAAGNAWYTAAHLGGYSAPIDAGLLKVNPSGAQTYFMASPRHSGAKIQNLLWVTIGSDGNPWFSESENFPYGGSFGFISASTQAVTQYATSTMPFSISQAPTGVAFATSTNTIPGIQFASQNGQLGSFYQTRLGGVDELQYRASDSTIWLEYGHNTISSIDASGTEHDYTVCDGCYPVSLAIGPDGSVWSAGDFDDSIIRVTPSGDVLHYLLPIGDGFATALAVRADGKLWVYDNVGALLLFDPAAYDAMNDPHTTVPTLRRTKSNADTRLPWRKW